MCLDLIDKNELPTKAAKDIECFKVLIRKNDELITPNTYYPMQIGQTYTEDEPFEIEKRHRVMKKVYTNKLKARTKITDVNTRISVFGGGYHTYKNYFEAHKLAECLSRSYDTIVVKCIIPKKTYYYEGIFEYCSKTLILEEILEQIKRQNNIFDYLMGYENKTLAETKTKVKEKI